MPADRFPILDSKREAAASVECRENLDRLDGKKFSRASDFPDQRLKWLKSQMTAKMMARIQRTCSTPDVTANATFRTTQITTNKMARKISACFIPVNRAGGAIQSCAAPGHLPLVTEVESVN
jgi:phage terminase large subunit-like protein